MGVDWWVLALAGLIGGAFTLAVLLYAGANIWARGDFVCRLDSERFTCVSPADGCGDSFDLAIGDITKIEREDWSDDCRWYVWDTEGHRYWVSSNYGNPVYKFIEMLERVRPGIERIET